MSSPLPLDAAGAHPVPTRKPSEFDPFPGQPTSATDRTVKAARDAARKAGQHVPPIARPTTDGTAHSRAISGIMRG